MAPKLLRLPDVTHHTGLSKATIYRLIKSKRFPKPVKLADRAVGWRLEQIEAWIASRESA